MYITEEVRYIGVDDHRIDLFEGLYPVSNGMAYNSYVILDEKIAVLDTVEEKFATQWLQNLDNVLGGAQPDYLIVQHMEPDHSANIMRFMERYRAAFIVASAKAFSMMQHFFGTDFGTRRIIVGDGDLLALGRHKLYFATAPMVHWPEVMVTYDSTDKILFSADAFGKFGALDREEEWTDEARRDYFGIVGKYGLFVQKLLAKVTDWDIRQICPLHGPVLAEDLEIYLKLYQTWSAYQPEDEGVVIAYTSIYGNTAKAVHLLAAQLEERGCSNVKVLDLIRCDRTMAVAEAFRYSKLVLATTTYNAELFPPMREFINELLLRNFTKRTVAFVENGGWAIVAAKLMKEKMEKCKEIHFAQNTVRIQATLDEGSQKQIQDLAEELCAETVENS